MMDQSQSKPFLISSFLIFVLILSSQSRSITAQEFENYGEEFDYCEHSKKGPQHWGDLKPGWFACKNGTRQSPIPISKRKSKVIRDDGDLERRYKPAKATLKNRGFDIMLQWSKCSAGKIRVSGNDYFLAQAHWHSPSEHTINGKRYDLELHMVHASPKRIKNNVSVVAILYKIDDHDPDPFLSKMMKSIKSIAGHRGAARKVGKIDPNKMIKKDGENYYRYMGSLTTPPCSENVIWTVKKKIKTVTKNQTKVLRNAVLQYAEKNARPLQAVNNRQIKLYYPDD